MWRAGRFDSVRYRAFAFLPPEAGRAAGHVRAPPLENWSVRHLEREIPGLAEEILTEGVMRFLLGQLEACRLVDAPRRDQNIVGP